LLTTGARLLIDLSPGPSLRVNLSPGPSPKRGDSMVHVKPYPCLWTRSGS
jgi:hypothetical protein